MARIARSLDQLRKEINALAPGRSKSSDGWIGDPAHASRASRHNPNAEGVVCALDITHDPGNGCDIHLIVRLMVAQLRAGTWTGNPDIEYVISNGQFASRSNGWVWVRYTGSNPHTKHAHIAVGRGPDKAPRPPYDDTIPWGIAALLNQNGDDLDMTRDELKDAVREVLNEGTGHGQITWAGTNKAVLGTIQEVFNKANLILAQSPEADVDEKALAAQIVDSLGATMAKALADELARRLSS